jgi:hypothetical protein
MPSIVFLIEQTAIALYILIGVGILICAYQLLRAQGDYRATFYELERDIARYRRANALTVLILLAEVALVVVGVQRVVAPEMRVILRQSNQPQVSIIEDGTFITPTPSVLESVPIDASGVQLEEEDPAERVLATPTMTPTPVGTIIPNMAAPEGCDTPNAFLQVPTTGLQVFEPLNVIGTAYTDNFAFYRFEIKGEMTFDSYVTLDDHPVPVGEIGDLGTFNPSFYEPGDYQFRLTVFNSTNELKASCAVSIRISDPVPTATPLGLDLGANPAPINITPAPGD